MGGRNYQSQLRGFLEYLVDERYPWRLVCAGCSDRTVVQLLDPRYAIVHAGEHESDPGRRPLTRDELQALFDQCDRRVAGRRALRRKDSLAAVRDGAMFKVCCGWGLRRTELIGLDVCDLLVNPQQPGLGPAGLFVSVMGRGRGAALRSGVTC
jgi:integrase